ncbi:MAG: N-acetylmuramoyl-L-alanine amidase, partial [Bacteroidia bacterium]|nr:N-acetylmuramoyl-L-alanine amidase [Bacteroidia bacterium]
MNIELPVRNIGITVSFLAITLLISASTPTVPEFEVDVVVIDAGHGGKDNGTHGKKAKEKDVALDVALKVGSYI